MVAIQRRNCSQSLEQSSTGAGVAEKQVEVVGDKGEKRVIVAKRKIVVKKV